MNKRKNCIAAAIIIAGVMMVGCNPIETRIDMISLDVAKEVALKDAGIVDERIVFTTSRLDAKNEKEYYDIDFFANGYKYEYDIDALTGVVIEAKKPEVKLEEESTYTQEDMEEIQEHIWEEYDKQQEKIQETLQKIEEVEAEHFSHSIADSKASEESNVA